MNNDVTDRGLPIGELISIGGDELEEKADILLGCLENELDMLRSSKPSGNIADKLLLLSRMLTLQVFLSRSSIAVYFFKESHLKLRMETSIFPPSEDTIPGKMIKQSGFPVYDIEGERFEEPEFWGGISGLLCCVFQENFPSEIDESNDIDNGFDFLRSFLSELIKRDETGYFKENIFVKEDDIHFKEPLTEHDFDYEKSRNLLKYASDTLGNLVYKRDNSHLNFEPIFTLSRNDFKHIKEQLVSRALTKNKVKNGEKSLNYFKLFKLGELMSYIDCTININNLRKSILDESLLIILNQEGYDPSLEFSSDTFNFKRINADFVASYKEITDEHEDIRKGYSVKIPSNLNYEFFLEELKNGDTYKMDLPKKKTSIIKRVLAYSERKKEDKGESIAEMLYHYCWHIRRRTSGNVPQGKTYLKLLRDHSLEDIKNIVTNSPYSALTPHVSVPKDDNFYEGS